MLAMRWALLIAIGVAACGNPAPPVGDDDGGPDAETPGSGLELRWNAQGVAGPIGEVTVDEVHLWLADLRVLGDAAPGDDRTYLARAEVTLDGGDPPAQRFDDAPAGRYSAVDFATEGLADSQPAWRIRGSVDLGGTVYPLDIEDEIGFSTSLALSGLVLAAGEHRRINLEVDVSAVVEDVDWASLRGEEDHIEVDDEDAALAMFRARVVSSITVAGIE